MVQGPLRVLNTALFNEFPSIKDRNNTVNYKGPGYLHAPILTIRTTLGHELAKVVVNPNAEFEIGRANNNMPEHPNKYVIMPYNDDFVSRVVAKFLYKNDGDVTFTLVKVAEDSDPLTYPKWKVDDEEIDSTKKNFVITVAPGYPSTITHLVTEAFGYTITFEWNFQRCKTVSYRAQVLAGPETLPIDPTQEYNNGAGAAGGAGGAGRAGAAGGAGGADARVGLLDEQTIKAITDQMDPKKMYTAFKVYSLNEANEGHILELSLQVEEKFIGQRMPFGTETQVSFLWFEWAKKPENKNVLETYTKFAADFNTAHKNERPERKKRKANARTGGRTGADKYTGDESD